MNEAQEKIASDTELQKMLAEVDELLTEDQELKSKQEEEERLSNEHMEKAASIEKERKRIKKYINIIRDMSAMTKAYAKMIEDAIDPKALADSLQGFRYNGKLNGGVHEEIVEQFGLQEEKPEEAPPILQESAEVETIGGIETLAVGSG